MTSSPPLSSVLDGLGTPIPGRAETVAARLREAISDGRLEAGQKLDLNDLARLLHVSRMPVRDAVKLLESEGLVQIFPHRGVEVSRLNQADIEELFGLREVLEQKAVRRAVDRFTQTDLDAMATILRDMDTLADDEERWLQLNARFHAVLNGASGWPRLIEMINMLRNNVERYVRSYVVNQGRARPQAQHWALYEACKNRDADAACKVIAEHLRDTASAVKHAMPKDDMIAENTSVHPKSRPDPIDRNAFKS